MSLPLRAFPPRTHYCAGHTNVRTHPCLVVARRGQSHRPSRTSRPAIKPPCKCFWYGLRHYWRAYHPLRTYRTDRDYYDYRKHPTRKCSAKEMYTVDLPPRMRTTLGHKDRDKVLVLRSYAELVAFSAAYGVVDDDSDDDSLDDAAAPSTTPFGLVRWGEVARDYGGVEVSAWAARAYDRKAVAAGNAKENDPRVAWFDGWDVPSGCVWSGTLLRWIGGRINKLGRQPSRERT